jgi:hypothetical protein
VSILRVFPRRTSLTPRDDMAFVGYPPLLRPEADEVHVSVAFTWDRDRARLIRDAWAEYYPVVKIGGPAMGDRPEGFAPGRYVRPGVTFTTRGCNNRCPWCLVPKREGKLVEITDFSSGYILQDNNLLQASRSHIGRVLDMLSQQPRAAVFAGGLQASLVSDWFVDWLFGIRVEQVFLAADTVGALGPLGRALHKLKYLGRRRLRVYAMIGTESIEAATARLEAIWMLGGLPFAQLYQPPDRFVEYSREWKALTRTWSRPAAMYALHRGKP